MGKKLDKKAKAAVAKAAKGVKVAKADKAVKNSANSRASCGLASTCSRLPSSMERRLLLPTVLPPVPTPWARLPASITSY